VVILIAVYDVYYMYCTIMVNILSLCYMLF